ncbi:MAG: hypothetical protein B7Y86_09660 [Brevundimonas subvibrioides]|uniref:Uncharacterized protein n=1 Tax=Brevundimonas subvibrioides TaxID=74313 RepID=A0A258HL16_9CAUL|nr:MAG: hypothetical protein B7Y86_09660 [Brevundimonas subvibrioides]
MFFGLHLIPCTPAKAGVQIGKTCDLNSLKGARPLPRLSVIWPPAFAGMRGEIGKSAQEVSDRVASDSAQNALKQ